MRNQRTTAVITVIIIILLFCFSGCSTQPKIESIPSCDIPMQEKEQQCSNYFVKFKFEVPENWISEDTGMFSFATASYEISEKDVDNPEAWVLFIKSYRFSNYFGREYPAENQKIFNSLFNGDSETYKDFLNFAVARNCDSDSTSSSEEDSFEFDVYGFLVAALEETEITKPSTEQQYISEYDCQIYSGNTGKIAAVKYTVDIKGKKYLMIDCIREDIPYMVSGCFDSNLEISSGDVALWTANSLEADENFVAEDGRAKKNS